jgi:hypothetical protein
MVLEPTRRPQVVQDNDLARSSQKMSIHEKRLLWWALCAINRDDRDFHDIEIPVNEFLAESGKNQKNGYMLVIKSAKTLPSRTIEIGDDEEGWLTFQWLSESEYIPAKYHPKKISVVRLRFHDKLKPYLLQLTKNFNKLDRKIVFLFSTHNFVHLYEILHHDSHGGQKDFLTYEVNDLRKRMGLENLYEEYKDFRNLLSRAQKEFQENGELTFTFEGLYQGVYIRQVRFHVKTKMVLAPPIKPKPLPENQGELAKRLLEAGFLQDPNLTITTYGEEHVLANLEFALERIRAAKDTYKPIVNPGGFIASCIQKNLAALGQKKQPKASVNIEGLVTQLNETYDHELHEHFNTLWSTLTPDEQQEIHEAMREDMNAYEREVVERADWEGRSYVLVRSKFLQQGREHTLPEELKTLTAYVESRGLFTEYNQVMKEKIIKKALKERKH